MEREGQAPGPTANAAERMPITIGVKPAKGQIREWPVTTATQEQGRLPLQNNLWKC